MYQSARLIINLNVLRHNYGVLNERAGGAECAAVVKANGYGVGDRIVTQTLLEQGCKTFFVATLEEGVRLRHAFPNSAFELYVMFSPSAEFPMVYHHHNLRPVLNSMDEIKAWQSYCDAEGQQLPCAIHIDSGMSRTGLDKDEREQLMNNPKLIDGINVRLLMSHLACGDEPNHPKNAEQLEIFKQVTAPFPNIKKSLSASTGIYLDSDYHFDLVRSGRALYGGLPYEGTQRVVGLKARVIQKRTINTGETVGYSSTYTADKTMTIATIGLGYADGFFRSASGAVAYHGDVPLPIVGRVSMDSITLDATAVSDTVDVGDYLDIICEQQGLNALADHAGTIPYEILTNLGNIGNRFEVVYRGMEADRMSHF